MLEDGEELGRIWLLYSVRVVHDSAISFPNSNPNCREPYWSYAALNPFPNVVAARLHTFLQIRMLFITWDRHPDLIATTALLVLPFLHVLLKSLAQTVILPFDSIISQTQLEPAKVLLVINGSM